MAINRSEFIKKVGSLLAYHKSIGISDYPRNRHLDSFCETQVSQKSRSVQVKNEGEFMGGGKTAGHREGKKASTGSEGSLSDIGMEIAVCRACDLHKQRIYPVAGRGVEDVRVLIVGDWLSGDIDGHLPKDRMLGVEQDQMLSRMLEAIKLVPEDVFITNVIKCAVPASCHPAAVHVHCCMSFLRRQIALLTPELICTMGMIAAKAVLGRSQSLSQLRGKFHTYETDAGLRIPVITTYHPTYLLQNPEMKKATWADLQVMAKRL